MSESDQAQDDMLAHDKRQETESTAQSEVEVVMENGVLWTGETGLEKEKRVMKELRKSNHNKKICGVCGGIGEYFGWDPTVIRLVWAIVSLFGGTGILAYIVAAIIMPEAID